MTLSGFFRTVLAVGFAALLATPAVAQTDGPDALIKGITSEVVAVIKADKDIQNGDPKKIGTLVETKILPHFNFARMTQSAVAVSWRRATPEQQKQLTDEFRSLLVRTYSNALSQYRDQTIEFKPLRARPDDTDVTVQSEVRRRSSPQPVTIDYDMEKTPAGWKVYDVKVGGVSLIAAYQGDFANQIREGGIDGLIKTLSAKNRPASKG